MGGPGGAVGGYCRCVGRAVTASLVVVNVANEVGSARCTCTICPGVGALLLSVVGRNEGKRACHIVPYGPVSRSCNDVAGLLAIVVVRRASVVLVRC